MPHGVTGGNLKMRKAIMHYLAEQPEKVFWRIFTFLVLVIVIQTLL